MKKTMKLSVILCCLFLQIPLNLLFAQNTAADKSGLVGTAWEMVMNVKDNEKQERTMYFKKNFTFETRTSDGSVFNGGKYSVIDSRTFVTVHSGSQSACLYNFSIKNDTLHFRGHYIDSYFNEDDNKIGFSTIEEIWVKKTDWVDKNEGIQFSEFTTFTEVLEKSSKEGKFIFMDCYTEWCGPCKYLANNIFPLKTVGDFYNKNFINVSFDMETPEGRSIATKYGVRAYPTLLFINSKGEVEHMSIGAGGAEHLLQLGKTALDTEHNLKALQLKLKNGDRSAETIKAYLSANNYAKDKKVLLSEYFKNKKSEQRLSEDSWQLFNWYDNDVESQQFKFFVKHRAEYEKKFGKKDVKNKLWQMLNDHVRDSVKYNSLRKVDAGLFMKHKTYSDFQKAYYKFRSDKKNQANWNNMLQKATLYFGQDDIDAMDYNNICWFIYENYKAFNDTEALKQAKDWSSKSHQMQPEDIQINDTYAHILFDLGFIQEAIKHEELALKKGQELKSSSVKFFTDELARFKKALN